MEAMDEKNFTEEKASAQEPKRAKHAVDVPEYVENAKKMRRNLTVAIIVLLVIVCAIGGLMAYYLYTSQNATVQQQQSDVAQMDEDSAKTTKTEKSSTVPTLATLIGTSANEIANAIGHGAQVSSDESKDDENDPVKRTIKLTLTNDVGSDSSGNPTVVVNANSDGNVTSVTYSASTKALGYGTMSFTDAIQNEKIIEKVMKEAGLTINSADVVLPENKADWTTYTEDGKRISREEREFSGEAEGKKWSATLSYDYTVSLATDNLSDTLRNIRITISS